MFEAARHLDNPFNLAFAFTDGAVPLAWLGRPREGIERAEEALTVAREHRLGFIEFCIAPIFAGIQYAHAGDPAKGYPMMAAGISAWEAGGDQVTLGLLLTELARAQSWLGALDAAMASANRAVEFAQRTGEVWCLPESYRMRGEIRLRQSATGSARESAMADFTTAVTVAKAQGAKSWALRAALDLAKLHREIGDAPVAREALEPVYASFHRGLRNTRSGGGTRDAEHALGRSHRTFEQFTAQMFATFRDTLPSNRPVAPLKPRVPENSQFKRGPELARIGHPLSRLLRRSNGVRFRGIEDVWEATRQRLWIRWMSRTWLDKMGGPRVPIGVIEALTDGGGSYRG